LTLFSLDARAQVHYLRPPNSADGTDSSGVIMHLTAAPVPRAAGILMFASSFVIPAGNEDYHVKAECCYDGPQPLTAVAFRVHTHTLGRLVWLDRLALGGASGATDAAPALRRSPLLPQAFALLSDQAGAHNPGVEEGGGDPYINGPLPGPLVIAPGQRIRATCRFNASGTTADVSAGATHANEMCNLYLLFHADAPTALGCYDASGGAVETHSGPAAPRPDAAARLAALPHAWAPPPAATLGQAGGIALSPDASRLWVFHRGARVWQDDSFDGATHTMPAATETIPLPAVLALDVGTGEIKDSFGAGEFLMPHGLSTDAWGNVWLTDVGLHQVFKYTSAGQRLLALGAPRAPGGGADRFCQPAAVVAASDGSSFVADGYCGARIAAFTPNGTYRGEWAPPAGEQQLFVPHALALDDCAGLLHVADRENKRVITLANIAAPPEQWRVAGSWDLGGIGMPYALARAAGGDVFALAWDRGGGGATTLARLGDGRAAGRAPKAPPAATWPVPGADAPHALALAAGPGGGPGQVLFVGETRPAGGSLLHRFSLGDVDICPWSGCGAALPRLRAPGVGPGYTAPAAQRRRVLLTRAALVAAIALLIAAASAPAVRGARMLPGGGASAGGAPGSGGGGGARGRKARQSSVGTPDVLRPGTPTAAELAALEAAAAAAEAAAAGKEGP
jgi:hypothetical protein